MECLFAEIFAQNRTWELPSLPSLATLFPDLNSVLNKMKFLSLMQGVALALQFYNSRLSPNRSSCWVWSGGVGMATCTEVPGEAKRSQ